MRCFHASLIPAVMACACALAACSPRNPVPKQPDNAPQPQAASSVVLNSPLGPLVKARDRAKAVQKVVNQQAAQQNQAIDDQSH